MTVKNNDVLGYHQCSDCGERATVHKTSRGKSRYLYKRCGCGCDQRTGKAVQERLFFNTEWLGDPPEKPPNVGDSPKVVEPAKQPEIEPKSEPELEPSEEPETTEKQPKKRASTGFLVGGALLALAAIIRGAL